MNSGKIYKKNIFYNEPPQEKDVQLIIVMSGFLRILILIQLKALLEKRKIAQHAQILLFQQCFHKMSAALAYASVEVFQCYLNSYLSFNHVVFNMQCVVSVGYFEHWGMMVGVLQ